MPPARFTSRQSSTRSSVRARKPGPEASIDDIPKAPSCIASATRLFIWAIWAGVGRSNVSPMTQRQMLPWPTYEATFTDVFDFSSVSK